MEHCQECEWSGDEEDVVWHMGLFGGDIAMCPECGAELTEEGA